MVGGAAAALTGLILVAVSLHLKEVLGHPLHRDRSFTSLQGLVTVLITAAAVLSPQSLTALGIALVILGIYWLTRYARSGCSVAWVRVIGLSLARIVLSCGRSSGFCGPDGRLRCPSPVRY